MLRLLIRRYDHLVSLRTQAACRLHAVLRELVAGGAPRRLGADRAAKLLRGVHPEGLIASERKRLAGELLADVRRLDREIAAIKLRIRDAVDASATTLRELHGVGPIVARCSSRGCGRHKHPYLTASNLGVGHSRRRLRRNLRGAE